MKFVLTLFSVFLFQPAHASPNNFYCMEFTVGATTYSDVAFKACKGGLEKSEGICTQTVQCIGLTGDLLKGLQEKYPGKSVRDLTDVEKRAYFKDISLSLWVPTTLTCKGVKEPNKVPVCPMPDQCKNDMFFNVQLAKMDEEGQGYKDAMKRMSTGESTSFSMPEKAAAPAIQGKQ